MRILTHMMLGMAMLCMLCVTSVQAAQQKEKVLLDTDMVEMFDDGVALIMLANAPGIDLLGVTCVTGNSWVQEGVAYSLRHRRQHPVRPVLRAVPGFPKVRRLRLRQGPYRD